MTVGDAAAAVREALRRTPSLRQRVAAMDALDRVEREVERLQQALADYQESSWRDLRRERDVARAEAGKLRAALEDALNCKGPFNGTVRTTGGYPVICTRCANNARAALAGSDAPPTPSELRMHQALGLCWCGSGHTIGEALALNGAAAVPAERET